MKRSASYLFLLALPLVVGVFSHGNQKEAKADSINHQIVQEPAEGLKIEETESGSQMIFNNPAVTTVSKDKLLAITIGAKTNASPYLVDPYVYLQFSFMLGGSDSNLNFDMSDPSIVARLEKNSLYYPTSETGYTCPNRYYAESNCYFFLIKEGFMGTIFVNLSDYFSSDLTIDAFKIFSDDNNHWNIYELYEVYLCDDIYSSGKQSLLDLESLHHDAEFNIDDPDLTYVKQTVQKNTSLLNKVVDAHVVQSRLTMLNIANEQTTGTTEVLVNLEENYKIRDALIININNLLDKDLLFKISLIDSEDIEVLLDVSSTATYPLAKTDNTTINLSCNNSFIVMPASISNSTLLIQYSKFASQPELIKAIKFVFNNSFESEIGKIIDAQNSLTGNYKTLLTPIELKDTSGVNVINPSDGAVIKSSSSGVAFKYNDQYIYQINEVFNANQGTLVHSIKGDDVIFTLTNKAGYVLNKVYVNNTLVNVEDNQFAIPFTRDLNVVVTFKVMKAYFTNNDTSHALVLYEKFGEQIIFKVVLASEYTVDYARFNGKNVSLNSDYTFVTSSEFNQYEFEIVVRKIKVVINYIDNAENRHGTCSYEIQNSKLYLVFNPEEGYRLEQLLINQKRIDFNGSIYSLGTEKDVFVEVKFFKR